MDNESGPIEAKEVIAQGEESGDTTELPEINPTADSVSVEESEDYASSCSKRMRRVEPSGRVIALLISARRQAIASLSSSRL